ncbi:hypothetical protein IW261DRAFT_1603888 [Armillaria novae-zelandiae]|uniref:F-box domain-containing protein n=1 Tax=Armillaria novae-zelandiae TaxID=153914 RepID=A0AA39PPN5_9AGAR|nr:hypothetical protein IW261DRAFT_1603888 [Armillaria novae-zelandiae]
MTDYPTQQFGLHTFTPKNPSNLGRSSSGYGSSCRSSAYSRKPLSSRIKELLKSNVPPSPKERLELAEVVAQCSRAMVDLEQRITQVQEMLDGLSRERDLCAEHLKNAKALLHPIHTLPHDILREIFVYCGKEWDDFCLTSTLHDSNKTALPLWTISQVSRQWRSCLHFASVVFRIP